MRQNLHLNARYDATHEIIAGAGVLAVPLPVANVLTYNDVT